ncbi:hypothetical protein DFQ03_0306 [Maribacter caenipelagi]|uniref:DUF4369 domain-containing protein n=1 Tax=Maribacter caenipelagi TaxID=1447781 RepID=A0A4R7DBR1_9FLAO|nr:hypothetical protein [Maribacter caenipelagi]TDS18600.1 hypothetical protein DFQ03_0306 [Maribacter caenipelagi]
MKKTILLVLICCFVGSSITIAQSDTATLYFKNGNKLQGLAKLVNGDQVKFKKFKGDKSQKYHFENLEQVVINDRVEPTTYIYLETSDGYFNVVRELEIGAVNLYVLEQTGYSAPMFVGGTNGQMNMMHGNYYDIKNLYVTKGVKGEVTHLGSNQLFSKNFKNAASDYFSDCPELVAKIQNKEYKKKHIRDIVNFYNLQCNDQHVLILKK